jgi:hypothetical protein
VPAVQEAMAENAAAHRAGDGKRREREQGWLVGISEPGDHVAGLVGNDRPGDERDRDRKCGGYEPREGERNALPEHSDDEQAGGPHDRQPNPHSHSTFKNPGNEVSASDRLCSRSSPIWDSTAADRKSSA